MRVLAPKHLVWAILGLTVGLSAGHAKAAPILIDQITIPITGATFNSLNGNFTITGRPASDVGVFYNDGRQPNPVLLNFTIFSLSTIGLNPHISPNGMTIGYLSSGTFGNISLINGNNFSSLLNGDLVSLEMTIINPALGAFEGSGNFEVTGGTLANDFGANGGLATIGISFTVPANFNSSFAALANTQLFPNPVPEPSASMLLSMGLLVLVAFSKRERIVAHLFSRTLERSSVMVVGKIMRNRAITTPSS